MEKPNHKPFFAGRYSFHLMFWVMYAVFMVLLTQGFIEKKGVLFALMPIGLYIVLMGVLVYGHTQILIPRFFEKGRYGLYAVGLILLVAFYTFAEGINEQFWSGIIYSGQRNPLSGYLVWDGFYAFCFVLNSTLLYVTQKWADQRRQVDDIQIAHLETELKYLRAQVNPHFLFNGLNTIYGTIQSENEEAREMVVRFSDLLRYNLYEADSDTVAIGKEVVYLQDYVALQRARSNDDFVIDLTIQVPDPSLKIAPLLFVPFIENAFKYSTRDLVENRITILLKQTGRRVIFECQNAYKESAKSKSGIGLANVTRRLELIYKNQYTLRITTDDAKYTVMLMIDV